jgi:hypothetical protein
VHRPERRLGAALVAGQRRVACLRFARGFVDVVEAVEKSTKLRVGTAQVVNGSAAALFCYRKFLWLLRSAAIDAALFTAAAAALAKISACGLQSRGSFTASFLVGARVS